MFFKLIKTVRFPLYINLPHTLIERVEAANVFQTN